MNKLLLSALILALATLWGCNKDDDHDHQEITIKFLEPVDGGIIPLAEANLVHIHVEVEAEEENEEVEIRLYPVGDPGNLILDFDIHEHEPVIEFEEDVDLTAYSPGSFVLEVESCIDHECSETTEESITFSVQ